MNWAVPLTERYQVVINNNGVRQGGLIEHAGSVQHSEEQPLSGGNVSAGVVRVGDTRSPPDRTVDSRSARLTDPPV